MDLREIYELMDKFGSSPLSFLEIENGGTRVRLEKENAAKLRPAAPPAEAAPSAEAVRPENLTEKDDGPGALLVRAPLIGVFYASPTPGAEPFVRPGSAVKKGDTLCLIEAMKMISEVPSPMDGVVEGVLIENEELAAFDAPLFRLREL